MGKPTGKKKNQETVAAPQRPGGKPSKAVDRSTSSKALDEDTAMFISMSQEFKEEGIKLFQKRDHEGAMLKFEKALKLLPRNHIDVAYLRTNMASCYMQMGIGEYPRAINECNLALEVSPKYSKALLKRAKCYEALNRLDFAFRDVNYVLSMEPSNSSALEILDSVKEAMIEKGIDVEEKVKEIGLGKGVETRGVSLMQKVVKEKLKKKKKSGKSEERVADGKAVVEEKASSLVEKVGNAEEKTSHVKDKEVVTKIVEEEIEVTKAVSKEEKVVAKTVKLVFGEDIRWAQLPVNCSIRLVRDIVQDRFPSLKGVLVKYRDQEGDLVTITTTDELRLAELLTNSQGSLRLYIAEVSPDQEPAYDGIDSEKEVHKGDKNQVMFLRMGRWRKV
ncbi:hypothetical protein Dsin_016438 [Dipteronia sinensis]|uniref:PB1 domain-containing protein n=1 Tax=Dipteronia sinensis TaxID=43782 RepID=A0AAE0E5R0_9ROSI|nr:hypothetical protein Dsin_016438 [Dipteronia sinensis]